MTDRCSFTLDPDEWTTETGRECPLSEEDLHGDVWSCPRRGPHDGRCAYHAPDVQPSPERVGRDLNGDADPDAFAPDLQVPIGRAAKRLVGARFDDVDLSYVRLRGEDTYPIDLRCARLGDVRAVGAAVHVPLLLSGASLGDLNLVDATMDHGIDLRRCVVDGSVVCKRATFADRVRIKDAAVGGRVSFSGATCDADVELKESELGGVAVLRATVGGDLSVRNTTVTGGVTLRRTSVGGDVDLRGLVAADDVDLSHATTARIRADHAAVSDGSAFRAARASVDGTLSLRDTTVSGNLVLRGITAGGDVEIGGVERFGGGADGVHVDGDLVLAEAEISGSLAAAVDGGGSPPTISGRATLAELEASKVRLAPRLGHPRARAVDLSGSRIDGGVIDQPPDADPVWFDCRDATLGDVRFRGGPDVLRTVRFLETAFLDLQFSRYRAAFDALDWQPSALSDEGRSAIAHTASLPAARRLVADHGGTDVEPDAVEATLSSAGFEGDVGAASLASVLSMNDETVLESVHDRLAAAVAIEPTPDQREATLLMAKNGADRVGDSRSTSEFFIREKRATRACHAARARTADSFGARAIAGYDWGSNVLFSICAGYGERPRRVLGISVGIILAFAAAYAVWLPEPPYGRPAGYAILSLESFVTLVLGGAAAIPDPNVRLLAQGQGFIGAFLIALFVVTLARSIDR